MKKYFQRYFLFGFILFMLFSLVTDNKIYAGIALKDEAPSYREKGYEAQQRGDIDTAIAWYQKAISMDPSYAAPCNDLAVLFESKGWLDRAEAEYKKAIALDPNYKEAHTNLALLYERKGEVEKAAFHWMKRYQAGEPNDPWTQEARIRLDKLGMIKQTKGDSLPPLSREIGKEQQKKSEEKKEANDKNKEASKKWLGEKRDEKRDQAKPKEIKQDRKTKPVKKQAEPAKKPEAKNTNTSKWTRMGKGHNSEENIQQKESAYPERDEYYEELQKTMALAESTMDHASTTQDPAMQAKKIEIKDESIETRLKESLLLAENRLIEEKKIKKQVSPEVSSTNAVASTANAVAKPGQPPISPKAKAAYNQARSYYKQGEYARALNVIRNVEEENQGEEQLLGLKKEIKKAMKEESIKNHYNKAIIQYQKDDPSGAREEFKAILDMLPEE